jgi:carbon-monoxide dehydrogenase small subunit
MTVVTLTVNGEQVAAEIAPRMSLADFLREYLRLTGTHLGCEHGICGACTVLIDDAPARACITLAVACDGSSVRTIEGFADDPLMAELRENFSREHALQCGFCTPGMLIAGRDIALRMPDAGPKTIRHELSGNLCRCTGYAGIVRAVASAAASDVAALARTSKPVEPTALVTVAQAMPRQAASVPTIEPPARSRSGAEPAAVAVPSAAPPGWTRFEESFVIDRAPDAVWAALVDFPMVASCVPGAELIEHDDSHVRGRLHVSIGPIKAAFSGSAKVERDDARRVGRVQGAGSDAASGSRSRADATFRVEPEPAGGGSRVVLMVDYSLQGTLAQVSRSGVAQEIGRRLVATFAANLDAVLAGDAARAAPSAPLAVHALLWASLRGWIDRLLAGMRKH